MTTDGLPLQASCGRRDEQIQADNPGGDSFDGCFIQVAWPHVRGMAMARE